MRRTNLFALQVAAVAALAFPGLAVADGYSTCWMSACDSYVYYDAGGNQLFGYSRSSNIWGYEDVQAYGHLYGPNGMVSWSQSTGTFEAVANLYYHRPAYGQYYVQGTHYYQLELYWEYDGNSYSEYANVDPPGSFSIGGGGIVNDGDTASFWIQPVGTPTWYQWSYEYEPGAGNDPNVQFSSPWSSSTTTNSHWYALPDDECTTSSQSQYTIRATVGFGSSQAENTTVFTPVVPWNPGGQTYPPAMHYGYAYLCPGGVCRAVDNSNTWVTRLNPFVMIWVPPSSQFNHKTDVHEAVHRDQYNPGHLLGDLFDPECLRSIILQLSAATPEGLDAIIREAVAEYANSQGSVVESRRDMAEMEAYGTSNDEAPRYIYQRCGQTHW